MKNVVFWDIKTQFVPHRRHISSPLQSQASLCYVRFGVFTSVTMMNAVFRGITPCGPLRTDVSEELVASFTVTRISELGTMLAVTNNRRTDSCHLDGGGKFFRNVGSYKSRTA
jgi:hypothetical protein